MINPKIKDWPHVTEILKAEGFVNYSSVNEDILSTAQHFGIAVHKMCELYDLETLDIKTLSGALFPYLEGWKKAKEDLKLQTIKQYVEMPIWSKRWKFRGRLDRIMRRGKKLVLVDIKATTQIMPATALQTAFYQIGFEEMTKEKIKERWIIRLKLNDYELKPCNDIYDSDVCIGIIQSFYWKRKHL